MKIDVDEASSPKMMCPTCNGTGEADELRNPVKVWSIQHVGDAIDLLIRQIVPLRMLEMWHAAQREEDWRAAVYRRISVAAKPIGEFEGATRENTSPIVLIASRADALIGKCKSLDELDYIFGTICMAIAGGALVSENGITYRGDHWCLPSQRGGSCPDCPKSKTRQKK